MVTITDEILENAKNLGLSFNKNTRIIKRGRVYYMVAADGNEIELSDQLVSALGIK